MINLKNKVTTYHHNHPVASTLMVVALVGVLAGGGYMGYQNYKHYNSPDEAFKREAKVYKTKYEDMMTNVSHQVDLPKNEVPVLAEVSDPAALTHQEFFQGAQKGDRIIMYKSSKKVYLYRPTTKQIIAQAPLKYLEQQQAVAGAEIIGITPEASASGEPTPTKMIIPIQ